MVRGLTCSAAAPSASIRRVEPSSSVPTLEGLSVEAVEWLPSGSDAGLIRVRGRWTDVERRESDLPALGVRRGEELRRFESLPDARFGRDPAVWRATYLVPAALMEPAPDELWLSWEERRAVGPARPGARLPAPGHPAAARGRAGAGGRGHRPRGHGRASRPARRGGGARPGAARRRGAQGGRGARAAQRGARAAARGAPGAGRGARPPRPARAGGREVLARRRCVPPRWRIRLPAALSPAAEASPGVEDPLAAALSPTAEASPGVEAPLAAALVPDSEASPAVEASPRPGRRRSRSRPPWRA